MRGSKRSKLAAKSAASLSAIAAAEAVAVPALKVARLSAIGARMELDHLVEMLTSEFRDARQGPDKARGVLH